MPSLFQYVKLFTPLPTEEGLREGLFSSILPLCARLLGRQFFIVFCSLFVSLHLHAYDIPTISPAVVYTAADGETNSDAAYSGSAPINALFTANPEGTDGWDCYYEWRIYQDADTVPYIVRYEQDTQLDFTQSGSYSITLYARFQQGENVIEADTQDSPFTLSIAESVLQMPNAFSPNGDGINDIYKAKTGYQSLTEFHAYIFNRWGQKLFEWTDPAAGWDGTYKGKDVKDGVYYVLVKAKGADGKKYNIKRDVNLLRGYIETTTTE